MYYVVCEWDGRTVVKDEASWRFVSIFCVISHFCVPWGWLIESVLLLIRSKRRNSLSDTALLVQSPYPGLALSYQWEPPWFQRTKFMSVFTLCGWVFGHDEELLMAARYIDELCSVLTSVIGRLSLHSSAVSLLFLTERMLMPRASLPHTCSLSCPISQTVKTAAEYVIVCFRPQV